jgi:hypothetical protein
VREVRLLGASGPGVDFGPVMSSDGRWAEGSSTTPAVHQDRTLEPDQQSSVQNVRKRDAHAYSDRSDSSAGFVSNVKVPDMSGTAVSLVSDYYPDATPRAIKKREDTGTNPNSWNLVSGHQLP